MIFTLLDVEAHIQQLKHIRYNFRVIIYIAYK